MRDLALAAKQLRKRPGFAAVVILTLGSAMGVNTSLFSIFNASMLQPWAVTRPDRVLVTEAGRVSLAEWRHWTEHAGSFTGLVAMSRHYSARCEDRRVSFDLVSANYFGVLGVGIERGRGFLSHEDREAAPGDVAVISHRTWVSGFASDPGIVGRSILLDGVPFTVVGVADRRFEGVWAEMRRTDLWLPLPALRRLQPSDAPPIDGLGLGRGYVAGRLAPGVPARRAEAELKALSDAFRSRHGLVAEPIVLNDTTPYASFARGNDPTVDVYHLGLFLAITFVTLIACAGVANLLLARGYARRGEIAVRLALGASRARAVRELSSEALLLAVLASALGLAIAALLPEFVFGTVPEIAQRQALDFRLDYRVFGYTLMLSLVACVAFGLVPALLCTRISVSHALKDAHGFSAPSLKSALPGYQVAVSVALLAIAGLLVRGVQHAQAKDRGFSLDDVALVRLEFPSRYGKAERASVAEPFRRELESLVGPRNVALASLAPTPGMPIRADAIFDIPDGAAKRLGVSGRIDVSAGYFEVLRIPIAAGRSFAALDPPSRVAVVNESFARHFWPGEPALGRTILWGGVPLEVVGVARDAHLATLGPIEPLLFVPVPAGASGVFLVRGDAVALARAASKAAERIDARVHVDVVSGPAWIARATALSLFGARIVGGIGLLALVLATLGLFSVSAYAVERRTREIGIRMSLGARPLDVVRTVLGPASWALLKGLLTGGVAALCCSFVLRRFLYGLSPLDPLAYAATAFLLMAAGLAAAYLPAHRAIRVDPTVALRYE